MQEQQSTINQDSSLWIGLDSYKESNSGIFFGRDEEIRQLSGDIFNNIQTVIYGPSGTGKTSIIRAGIFKIARENRYLPVYVRLNHNSGSKTYTQQILDAIQDEAEQYSIDIETTSPYIKENVCQSLWEYFHCNEFWNEENYPVVPLIVVDQFEEIFTLGKNLSLQPDFFNQLSDLCDNKYPQYVIDYLNDRNNERIEYPESINYRFVISLREDFLARLEEQAETIPALKRNRFSLQCINEEQALDIILKPQPGLVSEDVAVLIIEKVTNKKYNVDFKFHDEPEILVEPAILSLFCRELDKKRREKNMPTLSPELIGEFGDNIIRDFYIDSLSSLSDGNEENNSSSPTREEKIDYLESRLITVDGFRDAVAYQNAIAFGFTKYDIKTLIDNRLVRIDEWDGTKRIEFIHDVLCKVANKHQKKREQEKENKKREEEAQKRLAELEKSAKWMKLKQKILVAVILTLIVISGGCFVWYLRQKENILVGKPDGYQTIDIEINVDSNFIGKPRWEADVFFQKIDNDSLLCMFHLNEENAKKLSFLLPDSIYQLDSIRVIIKPTDSLLLCLPSRTTICLKDSLKEIPIMYNQDTKYTLKGRVLYRYKEGEPIPVNQAYVALNGEVTRTDSNGYFQFAFKDPLMKKKGCLNVFKHNFREMQYELELLKQQHDDFIEVELPLCEDVPMYTLFERKRKAIDSLYRAISVDKRLTETSNEEMRWMLEVGVLDTVKRNLRLHGSNSTTDLFSEVHFVSCDNKRNSEMRPIYGWYKKKGNISPLLFYGTMFWMNRKKNQDKEPEYWRIRITSFEKKTFQTEEHSFIMENPRSNIYAKIKEVEY